MWKPRYKVKGRELCIISLSEEMLLFDCYMRVILTIDRKLDLNLSVNAHYTDVVCFFLSVIDFPVDDSSRSGNNIIVRF